MENGIQFEPVLSNFLDESFSNGSGSKPKKTKQPKNKTSKTKGSSKSVGTDSSDDSDSNSVSSKPKLTAEQIQQGADMATNLLSKLKNKNQDVKAVCGRRPLLKKNRATWDKCAADYAQSKNVPPPSQDNQSYKNNNDTPPPVEEKKFYQKPLFIISVTLVAVGGFFAYKKFLKKTQTPVIN